MELQRRTALKGGAAAVAGALTGGPFAGLLAPAGAAAPQAPHRRLRPIPDLRDQQVRLHLPEGFQYRSFHDTEFPVVLDDGTNLPGRHDGMGAFAAPNGNILLVRNHEVTNQLPVTAFGPGSPYDGHAGAGCTSIEVTKYGEVVKSWTSLNGTMFNCSGGVMPWGSWITCEETINGPDVGPDFQNRPNTDLEQKHGYIFEVPAKDDGQSNRRPITRAGRFPHEAVSFDPVDGILYLTEDNFEFASGFYRYIPKRHPMEVGYLDNEGRLQMLAITGHPNAHLEARQPQRATYGVRWVDIPDPDPLMAPGTTNDQALVKVGDQGRAQGAALFSRLEGQVYDTNVVYFTSTQGGAEAEQDWAIPPVPDDDDDNNSGFGKGNGQVWAYHCRSQTLQVLYQAPVDDTEANLTFDFPDNITTSADGTLVVCEDSTVDNYIRGLSRGGQLWDIALNRLVSQLGAKPTRYGDEFAGSTFSPDGHTLFVNIQASRGMTFAIWGPWQRIGV
ncbi:MAG TPA: alkaline phosphatase PhoX [Nocardioides sp.]|nr:alkaline phosphatase PhoX [Nocardioides sp.]